MKEALLSRAEVAGTPSAKGRATKVSKVFTDCLLLQTAIVFASENGLKVTVEDAKCVLANAFIQADLFQQFTLRVEQTTFTINLTVLMVCRSFWDIARHFFRMQGEIH